MKIASYLAIALFACKKEIPPTPVAPPPPEKPAAPAAPIESSYGDKYLVILSSSPAPGATPPSIAALEAKPELGAKIARLDSSRFKNLQPCYEIVVANAFDGLEEARAWVKQLAGIDHYLKNAGKYVGKQPFIDSYCEEKRSETPDACGGVLFAEKWGGAMFISLGAAEKPAKLTPLEGDRKFWRSPLEGDIQGTHRVGEVHHVFEPGGEPMRCRVKGFSIGVRGHPHFGYFQEETPPDAPGCGEPELFAELDCPRAIEGEVALAHLHDRRPPVTYRFTGPETGVHPLGEKALAVLAKAPEYQAALEEAERGAKERNTELSKTHTFRPATAGMRMLLLVHATFTTGDGMIDCGAEDVRVEVVGAFEVKEDGLGDVVLPLRRFELRRLQALLDLEGDGGIETFEWEPPTQWGIRGSDDTEKCELLVPFCDCGC